MALINCPECGKEISNSATICVHCGYPLEREKAISTTSKSTLVLTKQISNYSEKRTSSPNMVIALISALVCIILIAVCVNLSKQSDIKKYRADFTSETAMHNTLMSGNWWQTAYGGSCSIGAYVTFDYSFFTYIDTEGEFEPIKTQYKLDYENSTITTTDGSFYYDVIEYKNDLYLRQNPKADEDEWILFKLSENY